MTKTWTVEMVARCQSIFASVDVEAENMAEAREKAVALAREASWDATPPYPSEVTVENIESDERTGQP